MRLHILYATSIVLSTYIPVLYPHRTQLCINTAIVYMHRFYMFHSFTKFLRNPIASCALFLAAKVEEQPRKLEHVIRVAHMIINRDQRHLDTNSEVRFITNFYLFH